MPLLGRGKSLVDVGLAQAKQPISTRHHYFEIEVSMYLLRPAYLLQKVHNSRHYPNILFRSLILAYVVTLPSVWLEKTIQRIDILDGTEVQLHIMLMVIILNAFS